MIRAPLCLLLILASTLATIPLGPQSVSESSRTILQGPTQSFPDPNGTNDAFNVTFAHFDLYTRANTTYSPNPPGIITWSSNFTGSDGSAIPDTAFRYELSAGTALVQEINYTLNIPRGVATNTFITFRWNGSLGKGTNATYQLYNVTLIPWASVTKQGNQTFAGGPPVNATGGHPFSCTATEECLDVSRFIGFNLTLRFVFKSNSTEGIDVRVTNVIVASVQSSFTRATSHTMELKPSNQVEHRGNLTLAYNATVTYPKPNTSLNITHTWRQMVTTFFLPSSYNFGTISQNGTQIYPGPVAVGQGPCTRLLCTNSTFLSLNMTLTVSRTSTAEVVVMSPNAVTDLQPLLGGIPTNFWMPGDTVSVRMSSHPGFNVSGSQSVNFTDPGGIVAVSQRISNKGGSYVYNLTLPAEATAGPWNITGSFLSGYDFGHFFHMIRLDQILTTPLSLSGTAGRGGALNVQGILRYSNSTPARDVNATVFVVDAGSPPGPVVSLGTAPSADRLYISNITLANGVFTQGQSLIAFFTISSPTPSTAFSANITIEHLWYDAAGGTHGAAVEIQLQPSLGEPFLSSLSVYRMDITLTSAGVQVTVKSITTNNSVSRTLSIGTSGVAAFRQHFGTLKVSVTSKPTTGIATTRSLTSPYYAYVLHTPLIPSRLLSFNSTKSNSLDGSFSVTVPAERTLGAKRLTAFVLARDMNGVVLGKDQTMTVADSTLLTPTAGIPGEVTVGQLTTVTLTLKTNSSRLTATLTVNLDLSGTGTVDSRTLTIGPGQTETATFTFTAPAEAGSYLLTFSSPQYGLLISPKTLQVSLLQGSLQALIPAIIGLVAALVILAAYLIRRRPETEVKKEEKKRPAPGKPSRPAQSSSPRNP